MAGVALELRLMAAPDFRRSAPPVPVDRRAARARNLRGAKVSSLSELTQRVVKRTTNRLHLLKRTPTAGAVGQKDEVAIARRIDPE
jgi:hypothetical protein